MEPGIPPELLAWAGQQFSDDELAAGIREIRETGGLELRDFEHELVAILASDGSTVQP
jgi:hypothetical protein